LKGGAALAGEASLLNDDASDNCLLRVRGHARLLGGFD